MHSIYFIAQAMFLFCVCRSGECMFKMQIISRCTILSVLVLNMLCTGTYYMFYSNI